MFDFQTLFSYIPTPQSEMEIEQWFCSFRAQATLRPELWGKVILTQIKLTAEGLRRKQQIGHRKSKGEEKNALYKRQSKFTNHNDI